MCCQFYQYHVLRVFKCYFNRKASLIYVNRMCDRFYLIVDICRRTIQHFNYQKLKMILILTKLLTIFKISMNRHI